MVQVPPKSGVKERRVSKELPQLGAESAGPNTSLQASEDTDKLLDQMDAELAELKARYDQYFLGLERFEPNKDRDSLKLRLVKVKSSYIRNTAVRFRAQAIYAKYLSYERMWMRIAREMEEGTYRRDLFKARFRKEKKEKARTGEASKKPKEEKTDPHVVAPVELLDPPLPPRPPPEEVPPLVAPAPVPEQARPDDGLGSLVVPKPTRSLPPPPPPPSGGFATVRPTSQPSARPPPPPSTPPMQVDEPRPISVPQAAAGARPLPPQRAVSLPGVRISPPPPPAPGARPASSVSDDKVRAIYNAYLSAKRQCKESTEGVTLESISKTINTQVPQLLKAHNAKAVDFKVVIKNGKATLKAVPRT